MKPKHYLLIGIVAHSLTALTAGAQADKKQATEKQQQQAAMLDTAYLGHSTLTGGTIPKKTFDSLALQGITISNAMGQVKGFSFSYAERNLYEDSIGNSIILVDLLSEYCPGDSLSAAVRKTLSARTKKGDTAYFDNIKVALPNGRENIIPSMKFVIEK
jgi:hypothetical protein